MQKLRIRNIIDILLPVLVLGLAWFCAVNYGATAQGLKEVYKTLPFILFLICIFVSLWFQHGRVFYNSLLLMASLILLTVPISELNNLGDRFKVYYNAICILIPFNILLFSFLKERGITSLWGLIKLFFILLQTGIVILDAGSGNPFFARIPVVRTIWSEKTGGIAIPKLSIILFVLGICVLLVRYLMWASHLDIGFIGVLLSSSIIIHFTSNQQVVHIFYSAVFLILTIGLFETSYSLAFIDQLTGILSRRALDHELLRLGSKYAIAMVDIDNFKRFNDSYGHDVGDEVLRMIAAVIRDVSGGGKPFRYGGEEFSIIFTRKTIEDVVEHLEEIREKIEKRPLIIRNSNRPERKPRGSTKKSTGNKRVRITVSIGVAQRSDRLRTPQEVIKQADKALYKAKRSGRNCIMY